MKSKMGGYVVLLNYRYLNICIKATPISLLPISVKTDDGMKNFEEVSMVAMVPDDEYKMIAYPNSEELVKPICLGIAETHPEFKLEVKSLDQKDGSKLPYIEMTMPEVNDARHDTMVQAVKTLDTACDGKLKVCKTYYEAVIPAQIMLENSDNPEAAAKKVDEAKKKIEEIFAWHDEQRGSYTDAKNEEIEAAYAAFLEKKAEKDAEKKSGLGGEGLDAALSMKM